jgi:hypothetical protein
MTSIVISMSRSTSPDSANPTPGVNTVPPEVPRGQDVEPRVRPTPRKRATPQAVKRQPRTTHPVDQTGNTSPEGEAA